MGRLKLSFYFILCFVVFYIQPIDFGPIKGSLLTEAIVFAYFGFKIFSRLRIYTDRVGKSSLWVALKVIASPNIFEYTNGTLVDFFKFSIFPLFYHFFKNSKLTLRKMEGVIRFFSIFVILSAIPYLLGILKPLVEGYKLDIFGEEGNEGFVGLFQNSHSAGVVISLAIINLVFFVAVKNERRNRLLYGILIAIGTYTLYKTYVRTAYLTLIIGLIIIFFKQFKFKHFAKYVGIVIAAFVGLVIIYANDATLRNRIEDNYEYKSGNEKEDVGSGRLIFQIAAIDIWNSGTIYEKLFGTGVEKLTEEMEKRVSLKIHTHNGFTDALVKDGVFGLLFYLYYLWAIFKKIKGSTNKDYKTLCYATFFSYFFFQIVQGGIITPMIEIFLVFNLSLLSFFAKKYVKPEKNEQEDSYNIAAPQLDAASR